MRKIKISNQLKDLIITIILTAIGTCVILLVINRNEYDINKFRNAYEYIKQ